MSEQATYEEDGRSAFWSALSGRPFEERLLRLIDDPWLLGSIRERMGRYLGWMELGNVVPLSFEELVGPRGGGSDEQQRGYMTNDSVNFANTALAAAFVAALWPLV